MTKRGRNAAVLVALALVALATLLVAPEWPPTGQAFGSGEGCGGESSAPQVDLPEQVPLAGPTDGKIDVEGLVALVEAEQVAVAFSGPLADLLNETYVASGRPLEGDLGIAVVPRERFDQLQMDLFGDRRVGGLTVHVGTKPTVVVPGDLRPVRFVEVVQHEVGHARELLVGEQEPELAEIIQSLTLARLAPRFGARLLEQLFEPTNEMGHAPNVNGHLFALVTFADTAGDVAKAYRVMEEFDPDAALTRLREVCECTDPATPEAYRTFAEYFLVGLRSAQAFPGFDVAWVEPVAAFLAVRFEATAGRAAERDGEPAARARALEVARRFFEQHPEAGALHRRTVHLVTAMLRIEANRADLQPAERLALRRRVLDYNAPYPTTRFPMLDEAYVRTFKSAVEMALAVPSAQAVIEITDQFAAKFSEHPEAPLLREVASFIFEKRADIEQRLNEDPCAARTWYEAAAASGATAASAAAAAAALDCAE